MSDAETALPEDWFERWRQGDQAAREALGRQLVALTYGRLRALAHTIFHRDFPGLCQAHETASVLHEASLRLLKALGKVPLTSPEHYFRLAALEIRRVLLDMARAAPKFAAEAGGGPEPADPGEGPEALARWTEFHEGVEGLPEPERQVVQLCFYLGLPQAQAARALGLHPRAVSRLWVRAVQRLPALAP
jgi:RNA polymerase sigma factor (sigma-70 family)